VVIAEYRRPLCHDPRLILARRVGAADKWIQVKALYSPDYIGTISAKGELEPVASANEEFLQVMSDWLVTLPHDLKLLYEAAADADLDRAAREIAVGAIVNTISPSHLPGVAPGDFTHYCDDAILVRIALKRVAETGGAEAEAFRERFADFYDTIDERLAACRAALGDGFGWLEAKVSTFPAAVHKHKKVADYLDDDEAGEYLYEEGLEFGTEYDVDEEMLADRLKKASTAIEALEASRQADSKV